MGKKEEEKIRTKEEEYVAREALYRKIAEIPDEEATNKKSEIEQKYRVYYIPDTLASELAARGTYIKIRQGYTIEGVRLREEIFPDGKTEYSVSYKRKKDKTGIEREEPETIITKEKFDAYWDLVETRVIEKTRIVLPSAIGNGESRYDLHLDIYTTPALRGIVVAEIEFPTRAEAELYNNPPDILGEIAVTITGNPEYSNKELSMKRPDEIPTKRRR